MDRRLEIRTIVVVMMATCVPTLAAVLLIATSSQPDLAELDRVPQPGGALPVLTWTGLSRDRPHTLNAASSVGARILAVGYMMDDLPAGRTGAMVRSFLLGPEAGNLLHPAHRIGDQMIEAHLASGQEVSFAAGQLIRASGILRQRPGSAQADRALYLLEEGEARLIGQADIQKYFK